MPKPVLLCSTDLMTEMTDLTSDLLGSGIPFLDYKVYAERVFFPGHQESPLHRDLGVPESRRPTVEQGLGQLSNLLNSKLFLTKVLASSPLWTLPGLGRGPPYHPALSLLNLCISESAIPAHLSPLSGTSSSTPWKASAPSRLGTEPMWHLCLRWRCMGSLSTSPTSCAPCSVTWWPSMWPRTPS